MSMRTAELVSEWDSVPFDGGYEGLRALEAREFSGAVVSGPTRLFMLNGTVVGVLDGDLEAFEDGGGTARQAPHDALPLLVVMQARAGEPRAQYYTEETAISDVDRTLTDGKFTGYVELSENVLSGDYYLVYHQGRSMSVAWVGSSQRLVTDDEAFEQADGEVGIYQVMPAEIEPIALPEPESTGGDSAVGGAVGGVESNPSEPAEAEPSSDPADVEPATESTDTDPSADPTDEFAEPALDGEQTETTTAATSDPSTAEDSGGQSTAPSGPPGSKAAGSSQGTAVDESQSGSGSASETTRTDRESATDQPTESPSETTTDTASGVTERTEREPSAGTTERTEPEPSAETNERTASQSDSVTRETTESTTAGRAGSETPDSRERVSSESPDQPATPTNAENEPTDTDSGPAESPTAGGSASASALETWSIPSLDPELSSSDDTAAVANQSEPQRDPTPSEPATTDRQPEQTTTDRQPEQTTTDRQPEQTAQDTDEREPQAAPTAELEATLEEREAQIRELEGEIQQLTAENEDIAAERDRLQGELEEARAEIQRLQSQLDAADTPDTAGLSLSTTEAIDGTNLFVRYHSKGEATLKKAQDGGVDRDAVEENLRLEYHTQFDGEDAVVDGVEFETFLRESIQYRFVDWLVRNLLYEIRDTGHANAMSVLYEALPAIDRAELNGNVSVKYTEDGQEHREQQQFDVVVRDRMGNPLIVANINDSRQAATDSQMTDIVRNAERVGDSSGSLSAAFLVTSSFFEPEALETAEEATSSGLFSRDKRKSFVNLSRKDGYHLCLLEARNKEFHLAVPEL